MTGEPVPMGPLLVTFALRAESRPFQRLLGTRSNVRVLLTGIGRHNAENAIGKALAELAPALVLACGFAGGLNPELAFNTVVFSLDENLTSRIDTPPSPPPAGARISSSQDQLLFRKQEGSDSPPRRFLEQSPRLSSALLSAGAIPGRFLCAERVVTTAIEKRELRRQTGADAVEMESGVIRAICARHNIASATVRVISDSADHDLPLDFNRLTDVEQNLHYGKLTAALLRSPGKIRALLQLQKQTHVAADHLARVLTKVLANLPC